MHSDDVDLGAPGASLQRIYEHRKAAREERIRGRFPRLGGVILALSDEPATTLNFARGAQGEVHVAKRLLTRCGPDVALLFNRRLSTRGRDGDIDVLAVTPNGVHVVDVKRYNGPVRVRRTGGLVRLTKEQLLIRGRDHTRLLDSIKRQQQVVRSLLEQLPDASAIPLYTAMCFVGADLPWITEHVAGVALVSPKGVARRLNKPGPLSADTRATVVRHLALHLPPA